MIDEYQKADGYVWPSMFKHIVEMASAYPIAIAEFAIKPGSDEFAAMAKQALGVEK